MRKSSSGSSRGSGPGSNKNLKKDEGRKPLNRDSKPSKKNYDGRPFSAGTGGDTRSGGPKRPYSGRVSDSDAPKRAFGGDNDRKPYGDRPKRSFDKPNFSKEDAGRKPFDRDAKGGPKRPYSGRVSDSDAPKKAFGADDDRKLFGDRPKRSFDKPGFNKEDAGRKPFNRDAKGGPKRPYSGRVSDSDAPKRAFGADDDRKPFGDRPKRSFDKPGFNKKDAGQKPRKEWDKPRQGDNSGKPFSDRPKRSFDKPSFSKEGTDRKQHKEFDKGTTKDKKSGFSDVMNRAFDTPKKPVREDAVIMPDKEYERPDKESNDAGEQGIQKGKERKPSKHHDKQPHEDSVPVYEKKGKKQHIHDHPKGRKRRFEEEDDDMDEDDTEISQKKGPLLEMPLNKFIAHCGECSRRDAAELVRQGKVKVNGELVLDPGYRVKTDDKVTKSGKKLVPQKGMVYILLNKPKGFITTNEDPQGRKTVMQLVANSGVDRLFPVGRLDRDTSGLLLITNDGDLTQKLCHPSYNIKKVYQVTLDKALTKADFEKIIEGVTLEDGIAYVDALAYLEKKNELGLEIHSGRNRIVRRIFESLGYVVEKLDRVMYAGLTKKNLPRSKWRFLDEREVVLLKHFKS